MSKKAWYEKRPLPKYIKVRGEVFKEGEDFTYSDFDGHINWNTGGGLLLHYAKPTTEKEYLKYKTKTQ